MAGDNCPKTCKHHTFHYCNETGTHCDKHCTCDFYQCKAARKNPPDMDDKMGGAILSGSTVVT